MATNWQKAGVVDTSSSPSCELRSVPIRAVRMGDGFWRPRLQANQERSIPALLDLLEEHGVLDNFRLLSGRKKGERRGPRFTDTDLYKWAEAVGLVLQSDPDSPLADLLDSAIEDIVAAQEPDGYLNTYYSGPRQHERYENLLQGYSHEFYCAGHLIQAAVAIYRANGDTRLLDAAIRFADHLTDTFGPDQRPGRSNHEELEMAMVELHRTTGESRYLEFAGYLLDQLRFKSLERIEGHAVRATYKCCGGADYYAETGDQATWQALQRLWQDIVGGKIYITGGIGSRYQGEAFGEPFELPNLRAYTETCAAIGNIMWQWRMLAITGEARFADLMETTLYNGFLAGVSLSGAEYFYRNPLASTGSDQRQPWHDCTCCPPNVERMFAALPGYLYSTSAEGLASQGVWVHLYDNSLLDWHLEGGQKIILEQRTRYPWEGTVELTVSPEREANFSLFLRIPSWCQQASATVNGQPASHRPQPGSYLQLQRTWQPGDAVRLEMEMPVVPQECDPRVHENIGCVALQRGPVVYCLESVDNPEVSVTEVGAVLASDPEKQGLSAEFDPDLLGGVTVLRGAGFLFPEENPGLALYRPFSPDHWRPGKQVPITAIPYYAWANREPSQMVVWIPRAECNRL